jgi:hypothetical protein
MGTIILAASLAGERCTGAEEVEANAIWESMKIAIDNNLNPSTLESDCCTAVAAANNKTQISSTIWHVYKNISLLRSELPGCVFRKIDTCCNRVAHGLARLAKTHGCRCIKCNWWTISLHWLRWSCLWNVKIFMCISIFCSYYVYIFDVKKS